MWRAERGSEDPGGGALSEDGALGSKWRTENLAICPFSSLCSGAWEEQGLSEVPHPALCRVQLPSLSPTRRAGL